MATPNPFDAMLGYTNDDEFVDPEYPVAEPEKAPEAPAPKANPFDAMLGYEPPEPEPEPLPPEEMGTIANLWAGLRERGVELAANLPGAVQTYGQALEGEDSWVPSLGGVVHSGGLDFDYLSPEEWKKYSEDGGRMGLRELQEEWSDVSFGFTSNSAKNWETLTDDESAGLWEKAQAAGAFALETGVISLADMAGAVVVPPAYIMSRAEEIAQERANQAGRPGAPTNDDLKISLGAAMLIQAMERFGFEKIAEAWTKGGPALKRILTAGMAEAGTEAVQEPLEFAAETYGTQAEEAMTPTEYALAAGERSAQGALGGGPAGAVLATPGVLMTPSEEGPISDEVKSTDENRHAIDQALKRRALQMEQEGVIRDEREMLESEQQQAELSIQRAADEIDAQEQVYKSAAHAEVKLQQIEKKYGETKLFPTEMKPGVWILEPYGMHSARRVAAERDERLGGIAQRPAEEGQIEVTEGEEIDVTEAGPTTEGIEVGEEIVATEPAPTTEGIEVTEEPPYGGGLIPEPTARRIAVTEEQAEEVIATEPAPTTEGIEGKEVTPEEVGEAIPQIGVTEITPEEAGIEEIEAPRKIYQRKKPPDDEEPPPGGAPVEPGGGPGPIMPSITSGEIKKGRKPRKGLKAELAQVQADIDEMPTDIDAMSEEAPALMDRARELFTKRRDLMDEQEFGVTPEEAKRGRAELVQRLSDEQGETIGKYDTLKEISGRIKEPKVNKVAEGVYKRVVDTIAAAAEEGDTPTVEYIQKKTGLSAKAAKKNLDRYNKEVAGEPDTTPLVSPETPSEQTQSLDEAEAAVKDLMERRGPDDSDAARQVTQNMERNLKTIAKWKKQVAEGKTTVEDIIRDLEAKGETFNWIVFFDRKVWDAATEAAPEPAKEHPKVPGRLDTDTLPDGSTYDLAKSAETQIATTVGTYDKVKSQYFEDVDNGDILDYGAGKGLASQKHGFESLEPYPRGWTPTYQSTYKIKRQYDGVILNNILNVLPKHTRRAVMWDAAEKLRSGGQMYINVRSRSDVMNTTVIEKQFNESEILTGRGTYQKGFQPQELIGFIQAELGPDYTVERAKFGSVSVIVTKKAEAEPEITPEEQTQVAAEAMAEQTLEGREATDSEAQIAAFNFIDSNPAFAGTRLSHKPGDKRGSKTVPHYYGDQDNTMGADGDPVDIILNKDFEIGKEYPIYIVNLFGRKSGDFEQHKVLAGFEDILAAEDGIEDMYPGQSADISQVKPDEYTIWRNSARTQEPFDRDQFRGEINKGKDLGSPTESDTVLDPEDLATEQKDAVDHSPWLLADGSIVDAGGDHMAYAMERGMKGEDTGDLRAISQFQLEGGGVRAAFFYDEPINTNIAWLHVHDDQTLTEKQIAAVEKYIRASKKAGRKGKILIGSTATHEPGSDVINPVVKKSSITGLKRDWGARKARQRADMDKFYAGLADKSAVYARAAGLRMNQSLLPDPTSDTLITFIRKHGGLNFLAEKQLQSMEEDYRVLNNDYRLPGLPGIVQKDGSGLTIEQAAEIATEGGYLAEPRQGEGSYDATAMLDLLVDAVQGAEIYSQQNEQWIKDEWEAQQEADLERMEAEAQFDAEYLAENAPDIDTEMHELMAQAAQFDPIKTEDIASRDIDDDVVKQQLRDLINERKAPKAEKQAEREEAEEGAPADAGVEAETPGPEGRGAVPDRVRQPEQAPDVGDYETVEEYPWQELAQAAGVEILEPPTPDYEGPRMFVIDVYSDIGRTKFVKQVFAANYFRYRDVETAYLSRKGPYKARIQERDEFIQISKMGFVSANEPHNLHDHILKGNLKKPYRKLHAIDRIEMVEKKDKKRRPVQGSGWLTVDQWSSTAAMYIDDLMAEPNPDTVVKHWGEEFKRKGTPRDYISHAEGKKRIKQWKKHAREVGDMSRGGELRTSNSQRIILSLFDATGEWAQPWIDAGYDVRAIDLKRDDLDIMDIDYQWLLDMGFLEGPGIWGVLAACPCQKFTNTNRRDFKPGSERPVNEGGADMIGFTHNSVDLVNQTLSLIDFLKPRFWALENPLGRVQDITNVPTGKLSFNPNNYGDPYTKKTVLHGNFNANLPTANVDPREEFGGQGTKMHKLGSRDELDGGLRSVTPEGFAYSFFMANNDVDNPIVQEIADQAKRTLDPSIKEKDPNIERKVELAVILGLSDSLTETDSFPEWVTALIDEMYSDIQEDWRLSDGAIHTEEQLAEMDAELRSLLGVSQKASVRYPQQDEIDAESVDTLNDLGGPYTDVDYSFIDPYMMEAAVDAVNDAIADLAAQGYTYSRLRGEPSMSLPNYLRPPINTIVDIASGAIPVARAMKAMAKGDKRTKPENALDRLWNWQKTLDTKSSAPALTEAQFKDHVRDEYPALAAALDAKTDDDPGVAMRRQAPGYPEAQAEMYESLGRDDMAWGPAPEPTPMTEAEVAGLTQPETPTTERGPGWEPVPELERPALTDISGVLEASTQGEAENALENIALTAEDGDRRVTHNAKWWTDAIDQRLKNLNKIRGCA